MTAPTPRNRRPSAAGGFTLLEILAATAMMAVVAGSLFASLHIAFKARDTALRSTEMVRKCDAAFHFIQDDLQSAIGPSGVLAGPFTGGLAAAGAGVLGTPGQGSSSNSGVPNTSIPSLAPGGATGFDGPGDSMSFYAVTSDLDANSGIGDIKYVEIGLETTNDPSSNNLVRRLTPNLLATNTTTTVEETICTGVRTLTLQYFDGTSWQDSWDSTMLGVLPLAVAATLELNVPGTSSRTGDTPGYRMSRVFLVPRGELVDPNTTMGLPSTSGFSLP
jgi:hypothetical protein